MIKHVELSSEEFPIMWYLSSAPATDDPRNHCVRLLDVILLPACETHVLVVMPLLYEHSILPFRRVGELVEISVQLIEVCFVSLTRNVTLTPKLSASNSCTTITSLTGTQLKVLIDVIRI